MVPSRNSFVAALLAFVVGVVLFTTYWAGLHGGFFFDDEPNILSSEGLRLEWLSGESIREALASGHSGPSGRPVAQLSFALNHYFSGFDPFTFKVTNLAIHASNGLLVFLLALRVLASARPEIRERNLQMVAGLVVVVWLLHPIQLLPVLYVVQRMTSLSAFFLFSALLLHIRARDGGGTTGVVGLILAWGVFWPLSFFSKETGALFPLFALAYELTIRRSVHGGLDRPARVLAAVAVLAAIAVGAYALSPLAKWLWAGYDMRPFSLAERLLTEARVLWTYLGLILLPRLEAFGLYHDDIALSHGFFDPWTTLPALAGLAGLLWLAWWSRRRAPLLSFGIAWFFIGHALESTVLPLEIAHEHRNYVPLFGILLPVACGLGLLVKQEGPRRTVGIAIALVAIAYPAFVTILRAHLFGEEVRRTQIEAQHHPDSAQAHYEAGRAMAVVAVSNPPNSPFEDFARRHYERSVKLDPNSKLGWLGLAHLACSVKKTPEPNWIDELSGRLRGAPFAPGDRTLLYNLKELSIAGNLCLERPDVERIFAAALANPTAAAPVKAMIHSWLSDYLTLSARDVPAAQAELDRSLAIVPHNGSNRLKRAQLAYLQGRRDEAAGMLNSLQDASLSRSERATLKELVTCLNARDTSVTCIGR